MTEPAKLGEGDRVGRFHIVRLLGRGGMGAVYEARDEDLARSIALKVLPVAASRQRIQREAQTLAKLQHPNVVGVHGLEVHGEHLCIAMELVDGETLDAHVERTKPSWHDIVALYVQAGRGLVAAHAKGIVHRDIKPSNLLVDTSGRVRVSDFGLARLVEDHSEDSGTPRAESTPPTTRPDGTKPDGARPRHAVETVDDALAGETVTDDVSVHRLTRTGAVLGTPLFMAPEQHVGERATAASDQFSFCVALWQALFDEHPFEIERGVVAAVMTDARRPAPSRVVPRWLVRALDRGLSGDAGERWPRLVELVDQLEHTPSRRRRVAIAAAAVAIVGGLAVWGFARGVDAETCPVPDTAVWSSARAQTLTSRLESLDHEHARDRLAVIARTSDGFVDAWQAATVEACTATRVRGTQSDQMLDARTRCLASRLDELDRRLARITSAPDLAGVEDAVVELTKITPVATCSDPGALATDLAWPLGSDARKTADQLSREVHAAAELVPEARIAMLRDIAARARILAHPPTTALAMTALAQGQLGAQHDDDAEHTLRELTQLAAAAHDDRDEAFAWIKLVGLVGGSRGKPVEAMALAAAARAAIARAGQPIDLRVDLLYAEGQVLGAGDDLKAAIAKLDEARALLDGEHADKPGSPYGSRLADLWLELGTARARLADATGGSYDDSIAAIRTSLATTRAQLGPDSPDEAYAWTNLANALRNANRTDEARHAIEEAIRIRASRLGDSVVLATSLVTLATINAAAKRWPDALEAVDRAIAMERSKLPPGDLAMVPALLERAYVLGELGRRVEEIASYTDIIAIFETSKSSTEDLGQTLSNRAECTQMACATAPTSTVADYTRAISVLEHHLGTATPRLVVPLLGLGRCLVKASRADEGLPHLERAVKLAEADQLVTLTTEIWLGRALIATGTDRARGTRLVATALAKLRSQAATDPDAATELVDAEPY